MNETTITSGLGLVGYLKMFQKENFERSKKMLENAIKDGGMLKSATESDPSGKQKGELGAKFDVGKSPVYRGALDYFPRALLGVAEVSNYGANKYAWKGWATVSDGYNRYSDALGRHLVKESIEGYYDVTDSNLLHAAQAAWNALARLEILLRDEKLPIMKAT